MGVYLHDRLVKRSGLYCLILLSGDGDGWSYTHMRNVVRNWAKTV